MKDLVLRLQQEVMIHVADLMEVVLDVMDCSCSLNLGAAWMLNSMCVQTFETYFLAEMTHKWEEVGHLSGSKVETVVAGWNLMKRKAKKN